MDSDTAERELRVLVLEDDADIREALLDSLVLEGFASRGAETIREATDVVRAGRTDAVLVDLRLSHGELGGDFIRAFADDDRAPPMVIVSASTDLATELVAEFNVPWVPKPFDIDVVVAAIHQAVEGRVRPRTSATQ